MASLMAGACEAAREEAFGAEGGSVVVVPGL